MNDTARRPAGPRGRRNAARRGRHECSPHDPSTESPTTAPGSSRASSDVVAAFKTPALSSDRVHPLCRRGTSRRRRLPEDARADREWMVVADPARPHAARRLAGRGLQAAADRGDGDHIQTLVDDLVARLSSPRAEQTSEWRASPTRCRDRHRRDARRPPGPRPVPLLVRRARPRRVSRRWRRAPDRHERALRGLEEMAEYFRALVAHRRREPGGDMLSAMITGTIRPTGSGLSDDELVGMCALLLFAGHETTTNAIANAVRLLTADPELRDRVRDDPALVAPAVEEALRLVGPIKVLVRWVIEDHELRGRTIRAGERVYLVLCGANRDPERFADPDTVDLARSRATHIAFGRGVHACIGAQLARIETRIAVGTLLRRLPGLRVEGEPEYLPTIASRAQTSLPVVHDGVTASRP